MTNSNNLCSIFNRRPNAIAFIKGSKFYPAIIGRVLFYQTRNGVVVRAEASGLPKGEMGCDSPIFAFHIHEGVSCTGNETDPFSDSKTHYNPNDCPHPYHAGDLPPLFSSNGLSFSAFLTDRFTVSEVLGKAIVIHSSLDDFSSQPSGNAGEKIACGIIKPTAR